MVIIIVLRFLNLQLKSPCHFPALKAPSPRILKRPRKKIRCAFFMSTILIGLTEMKISHYMLILYIHKSRNFQGINLSFRFIFIYTRFKPRYVDNT